MVRIPFASVLLVALISLTGACEDDPTQGALPPCPCDNGGCSTSSCPIEILLDQTCVADVPLAEVLIDQHVEVGTITPQATFRACSRIEPGARADITVRGGPWVWGPLHETCSTPGETRSLVLQCIEATE